MTKTEIQERLKVLWGEADRLALSVKVKRQTEILAVHASLLSEEEK